MKQLNNPSVPRRGGYWKSGTQRPGQRQPDGREELRDALRSYEEFYNFAPICFLTLNRCGNIMTLNERAARLLAFPVAWLQQRPFLVFLAMHDVARFVELLNRLRRIPGEAEMANMDLSIYGHLVPAQIWIRSSARGNEITYRMTLLDLSDIRAMQEDLRRALTHWHSLVESAPDVIMTVSRDAQIWFTNRPVWGYSIRALARTRLTDYVRERDRARMAKCIEAAFNPTADQPSSCEIMGVNGDKRWYSFSFGPVRRQSPPPKEDQTTTVTIRDISEHKAVEQSLRKSREELREFAARMDQVREEERTRMAREIHDQLGQALTILKLDLSWLHGKAGTEDSTRKKIGTMITHVDQTIETVRKIVTELRPSILDELGLIAAIEWQLSQFQGRAGIRTIFESDSDSLNLSRDVAVALFRIVQEALTNVMRHAGATKVRIAIRSIADRLVISVTDNGKGITRQQINDPRSFGIMGMNERVHRIGGQLNIYSSPGRGTRIEISSPLK